MVEEEPSVAWPVGIGGVDDQLEGASADEVRYLSIGSSCQSMRCMRRLVYSVVLRPAALSLARPVENPHKRMSKQA